MTPFAVVDEDWHDDVPVVRIDGEVDAANVGDVGSRLRAMMTNRSVVLVVDLSDTSYLDSAGINLLFAIGEELRTRQQALRLVVPPGSAVARMLTITSLDRAYQTYPSRADALAAS